MFALFVNAHFHQWASTNVWKIDLLTFQKFLVRYYNILRNIFKIFQLWCILNVFHSYLFHLWWTKYHLITWFFSKLFKNGDVGFPPAKGWNANESCEKGENNQALTHLGYFLHEHLLKFGKNVKIRNAKKRKPAHHITTPSQGTLVANLLKQNWKEGERGKMWKGDRNLVRQRLRSRSVGKLCSDLVV